MDVQATVAMTLQVLMVAEKPSIAGSIADVLGGRNITTRRKRVPVHEFPGTFEGRGCDFRVRHTCATPSDSGSLWRSNGCDVLSVDDRSQLSPGMCSAPIFQQSTAIGMLSILRACFTRTHTLPRLGSRGHAGGMTRLVFGSRVIKKENKGNMVRHLQEEARGVDVLVLWLDCDREGENICMEVVDSVTPKAKRDLRVLRAKFSAVARPDILKAMVQ